LRSLRWSVPKLSCYLSKGEEQQLGFVVLPQPKFDPSMLDSTYLSRKTGEEQQQTPRQLLFYQSANRLLTKFAFMCSGIAKTQISQKSNKEKIA
jgi:hypothetical protein